MTEHHNRTTIWILSKWYGWKVFREILSSILKAIIWEANPVMGWLDHSWKSLDLFMRDADPWTHASLHLFKDSITLVPIFLFTNFQGTNHMQNTCLLLWTFLSSYTVLANRILSLMPISYPIICRRLFVLVVFGIMSRCIRYPVSSCWLYYMKTQELHGNGPQLPKVPSK